MNSSPCAARLTPRPVAHRLLPNWSILLIASLLLCGCSDGTEQAKQLIESRLTGRQGVEYRELQKFPGDVVCGELKVQDLSRSSGRFRRFIVHGDTPEDRPSEDDWQIFCSRDAAAVMRARFGIGPPEDPGTHLSTIRDDLLALEAGLVLYLADNKSLPSTEQGLAALLPASETAPTSPRFREGGYIDQLPNDPWGQAYRFERSGLGGGVAQEYKIYTLGADGAPGGQGANADIGLEHLKYLNHILP